MGASLQVALLGPIEVRVGGRIVGLPGAPQRILIAKLALTAGQVVSVPELIDTLWVADPPVNANGNLHSYVSRLRRVIGHERVVREPGGYRLVIEPDDTDLGRAERMVTDARKLAGTDPVRAATLLAEALGLWRGEPLAELADRLPFAAQLAWLAEWRLQVREEWFTLLLDTSQAARALPELERAAKADPQREPVHLLLMRALHQVGRTADALAAGQAYRRRLADDTGLDPGPALADLERRLLHGDPDLQPRAGPPPRPASRRHAPHDRFVGRRVELEQVRSALAVQRVVTVVGPGGVGKTRLVLELLDGHGQDVAPAFLVELGDVSLAADVPAVTAAALGLRTAPAGAQTAIVDRLGGQPALLVLDGSEHVRDVAGGLVSELLARCPALRVLATSRQRLGIAGEQVIRLGPLAEAEQVELFCDRAARLRADFNPPDSARAVLAGICRLVDGLPLGIELAARREAVFGLMELRTRLARGLDVLEPAGRRDRSLAITSAVEWSYRLLDPDTQALFDRLSVCQGGFSLEALDHLRPPGLRNVAARLGDLVEASMVVADLSEGAPRYRLLETLRQIGASHLTPEQLDHATAAHTRWMLAHAETVYGLQREQSPAAAPLLRRELSNMRAVLAHLIDTGAWGHAARLAVLVTVVVCDDPHLDLLSQLRRLEAAPMEPAIEGGLCAIAAGAAAWLMGDAEVAERKLAAGLAALPTDHPQRWIGRFYWIANRMFTGDLAAVEGATANLLTDGHAPAWAPAAAVCCAALINVFSGRRTRAETWMTDHRRLLAEVGQVDGFVAYTRGELAASEDPAAALSWFDQAYRKCDAAGHTYNREVAAIGGVAVLIRLGRHTEAVPACRSLIERLRGMGMWPQVWTALRLTAELLVALEDHEPAAVVLSAADRDPLAPAVLGDDRGRQAALWARIAEHLDADRLTGARVDGEAGGRSGAVARALEALGRHR